MRPLLRIASILALIAVILLDLGCSTYYLQPSPNYVLLKEEGEAEVAGGLTISGLHATAGVAFDKHIALLGEVAVPYLGANYRAWEGELGIGYYQGGKAAGVLIAAGMGAGTHKQFLGEDTLDFRGNYLKPFVQINGGLVRVPIADAASFSLSATLKSTLMFYNGREYFADQSSTPVNGDFLIVQPGLLAGVGSKRFQLFYSMSLPLQTDYISGNQVEPIVVPFTLGFGVRVLVNPGKSVSN